MTTYGTATAPLSDKHAVLVANTADKVFITSFGDIEISNETGTDKLFVTCTEAAAASQPAPTVNGDNTLEVPAAIGSITIPMPIGTVCAVQVISSSAIAYSVMSELSESKSS